jgi:hypothetical protein
MIVFILAYGSASNSHASVLFVASEIGGDVFITGSGTLDVTGLALGTAGSTGSDAFVNPSFSVFRTGGSTNTGLFLVLQILGQAV